MKENDFFFFFFNLGMPGVHMQKYPKSTSTQKVSGTNTAPFLDYLCFIAGEFLFKIIPISNDSALLDLFGGTGWLLGFCNGKNIKINEWIKERPLLV